MFEEGGLAGSLFVVFDRIFEKFKDYFLISLQQVFFLAKLIQIAILLGIGFFFLSTTK
jgi:hypothetical protein